MRTTTENAWYAIYWSWQGLTDHRKSSFVFTRWQVKLVKIWRKQLEFICYLEKIEKIKYIKLWSFGASVLSLFVKCKPKISLSGFVLHLTFSLTLLREHWIWKKPKQDPESWDRASAPNRQQAENESLRHRKTCVHGLTLTVTFHYSSHSDKSLPSVSFSKEKTQISFTSVHHEK